MLPDGKDNKTGELPEVPFGSGDLEKRQIWHEREVYDLSGIWFVGHPLHRILLPRIGGHPLRKDYEFPLSTTAFVVDKGDWK